MVYGVCRAMLRDGHEAEDAAQQTFLLAHRALLGGAHVRNDAAWLATIARNESRTRIAASMRSPVPISEEDLAAIPTTGDEVERSAQLEAIRSALADLPERQREAVVLRDLYGLRYGEVATALGLSRPATEALLFRARRTMRQRLKPIVATTLVVPIAVQEGLAQAIPGFAVAGSGGVTAGVVGGGVLAKLTAGPLGVKVATATVAVTTVGAVGSVESERAGRDRAERAAIVAVDDSRSDERSGSDSSGSGDRGSDEGEREDDNSGSGNGGGGDGDDNSGPGSGDDDPRDNDRSGPSGGGDDTREDSSGPGSGSSGDSSGGDSSDDSSDSVSGSRSGSSDGHSSGSGSGDRSGSGDGASGSSGSPSGSSSSSGSGSGDDSTVDGSSGSGSGDGNAGSGSDSSGSGSNSSGKGSSEDEGEPSG